MTMLRIRSRDGLERLSVDGPHITGSQLKTLIQDQLQIPIQNQTLSINRNLLLAKSPLDFRAFTDMTDPNLPISSLNLCHGSMLYLAYEGERTIRGGPAVTPAGSFGRKMKIQRILAKISNISGKLWR